jgi:hypothetical protein
MTTWNTFLPILMQHPSSPLEFDSLVNHWMVLNLSKSFCPPLAHHFKMTPTIWTSESLTFKQKVPSSTQFVNQQQTFCLQLTCKRMLNGPCHPFLGVAVNDPKDVHTCNFGRKIFSRNDFFMEKLWKMSVKLSDSFSKSLKLFLKHWNYF